MARKPVDCRYSFFFLAKKDWSRRLWPDGKDSAFSIFVKFPSLPETKRQINFVDSNVTCPEAKGWQRENYRKGGASSATTTRIPERTHTTLPVRAPPFAQVLRHNFRYRPSPPCLLLPFPEGENPIFPLKKQPHACIPVNYSRNFRFHAALLSRWPTVRPSSGGTPAYRPAPTNSGHHALPNGVPASARIRRKARSPYLLMAHFLFIGNSGRFLPGISFLIHYNYGIPGLPEANGTRTENQYPCPIRIQNAGSTTL